MKEGLSQDWLGVSQLYQILLTRHLFNKCGYLLKIIMKQDVWKHADQHIYINHWTSSYTTVCYHDKLIRHDAILLIETVSYSCTVLAVCFECTADWKPVEIQCVVFWDMAVNWFCLWCQLTQPQLPHTVQFTFHQFPHHRQPVDVFKGTLYRTVSALLGERHKRSLNPVSEHCYCLWLVASCNRR